MSDYYLSRGDARFIFHAEHVKHPDRGTMRPVAVIDPEDREQVGRLLVDMLDSFAGGASKEITERDVTAAQAALREFANPTPPKPDEPTGKFAAVLDVDGREWVRTRDNLPGYLGVVWMDPERYSHRKYADITAVRVLSEGVTQ